ncbi:PadR family transcriptional regulator [Streptomyces sp. NPDC051976]|uniref:PadR family transcriptional regulator n=1 Tax=Streptomyces sp. NPDC051976 TaxID=3154947 RepID=UPI00343B1A70
MAKRRKLSNPLALAVMVLLGERPMHPYEIARLLRQRGKEHSIKINYGSLYTVVQNLEKHGFVEVAGVQRQGNRPERTLYGLTAEGRVEAHDWLADMVAVPVREYPAFEAALSLILALHPDEAIELLTDRADVLEVQAAGVKGVIDKLDGDLPRIFLVETEFQHHMLLAEAAWVRGLLARIADGTLSGTTEWRSYQETGDVPERWAELEERFRDESSGEESSRGGAPAPGGAPSRGRAASPDGASDRGGAEEEHLKER